MATMNTYFVRTNGNLERFHSVDIRYIQSMTEKIEYDKVVTVTRDDSILIEFLLCRLNEIPSWTKKSMPY